jgi:hypothetical protein
MTSVAIKAEALMRLTVRQRERAAKNNAGYDLIHARLGRTVADWAYADKPAKGAAPKPGQRCESAAQRAVDAWARRPHDWALVLSDQTGRGKTIAAARYVADGGGTILRAAECDGWGFNAPAQVQHYGSVGLLMIDDLGQEQNPTARTHLAAIMSDRAHRRARFIATTSLKLTGLTGSILALYGEPIESRLREHYVNLARHNEPDRRSKLMPEMTGFFREEQIDYFSKSIRYIAAGLVQDDTGAREVDRFAALVKVDLGGAEFLAMVATIERERAERSADAADLLARLAGPGVTMVAEVDADLIGWVDAMDEPVSEAMA